ncbi:MAG: LemA family protein [Planctomycetaceae bacterium]
MTATAIVGSVALVAAVGLLVAIFIYNGLVSRQIRCDNAWSDIDVQLKRRHDLVPNLVEVVRQYADFEKGTLEAVIAARGRALGAGGAKEAAAAEGLLTGALKSLFAVAEAYPQLRASEQFTGLRDALSSSEDALQAARRYYNASVRELNEAVRMFPGNLVAGLGGFRQREFFEITTDAERAVPAVKLGPG